MISISMLNYLFCKRINWCKIPVPLAVDSRASAPANRVHLPMGVVVVHHVEVSMSTPALSDGAIN